MEKQKIIPVLRFPQFLDSLMIKKLGEVSEFLDGRRKPIKESDRAKITGIYPYYGASGIIDFVNDYIFDDELILLGEDGENIISRNLPLAFKISGKCWVNNHAHVIKPTLDTCIDFLTLSLERISFVQYNTGTAQPKLNQEICKTISIPFPCIKEQTKIASFFTAIDDRLNQLKKKKSLLEQYKKGVMQKIFDQEIRFKDDDGKEYPDWEIHKIDYFVDFLSGYPFDGEDISDDPRGIPLMRCVNITEGEIRHSLAIDKYYCKDTSRIEKYFLRSEDLVIGMDGSKVGKNSALVDSKNANSILVQRVTRLRQKENSSIRFIYQHIKYLE